MPLDKFIRKISGQDEINSLLEFQERLDSLISKLEQEFTDSKLSEQNFQQKYSEKLSKLDFSGSKRAVEEGRHQLSKTLDLEVQLEFLQNIRIMAQKIPENHLQSPKQQREFNRIAQEILDSKKFGFQSSRRMMMKRFRKFVPISDDILLLETNSTISASNGDVERILSEVRDGISNDNFIDSDVEDIIREIRKKKDTQWYRKLIPTAKDQPEVVIKGAGHFLQEENGEEIARHIL